MGRGDMEDVSSAMLFRTAAAWMAHGWARPASWVVNCSKADRIGLLRPKKVALGHQTADRLGSSDGTSGKISVPVAVIDPGGGIIASIGSSQSDSFRTREKVLEH